MSPVPASMPAKADPRRQPSPDARQQPDRHLRAVPSPLRARRRLVAKIALLGTFTALFLVVAAHVMLLEGQDRIDQLNQRNAAAQERYHKLRLEVDRLEAPARIVAEATRQGMVQPEAPVWLAPSDPVNEPQSVDPGDSSAQEKSEVKPYLGVAR